MTDRTSDRALVSALIDWAQAGVRMIEAGEADLVQAGIDELPSKPVLPRLLRREALAAFLEMVGAVPELTTTYTAQLDLPLWSWNSTRLPTRPPSFERVLADTQSQFHVPGFSLGPTSLFIWDYPGERYYRLVDYPVDSTPPVHVYYEAFRPLEERERGWEFARSFVVRTYRPHPEPFRLGFVERA